MKFPEFPPTRGVLRTNFGQALVGRQESAFGQSVTHRREAAGYSDPILRSGEFHRRGHQRGKFRSGGFAEHVHPGSEALERRGCDYTVREESFHRQPERGGKDAARLAGQFRAERPRGPRGGDDDQGIRKIDRPPLPSGQQPCRHLRGQRLLSIEEYGWVQAGECGRVRPVRRAGIVS